MLCSFSRLNSSPVITVRKSLILPRRSGAHLLCVPGWQTSAIGVDKASGNRAEQLHLLAPHDVGAAVADVGYAGDDCFALARPDERPARSSMPAGQGT